MNAGLDTLFVVAAVNGDFDGTNESAEVFIDGVLLGPIATTAVTLGNWDSITFAITNPLLSTVLADGMIDVSIVNNNQVNTNVGAGTDEHKVRIYTKGEKMGLQVQYQ